MKVAITLNSKSLDQEMDSRFGRCPYYYIWDADLKTGEFLENPYCESGSGAGVQAGQLVANQNVDVLITGNVGPKASEVLKSAKVEIISNVKGIVSEVLEAYRNNTLKSEASPAVTPQAVPASGSKVSSEGGKRIAVSSEGDELLDAHVAEHFGRCPFYIVATVIEDKIKKVEAIQNPYYGQAHEPGRMPVFLKEHNVNVMISGGMGQRAVGFFNQFGIDVVTGASGTIKETMEAYLQGKIKGAAPCNQGQ